MSKRTRAETLYVVVVPGDVGYGPKQHLAFTTLLRARKAAGGYAVDVEIHQYKFGRGPWALVPHPLEED